MKTLSKEIILIYLQHNRDFLKDEFGVTEIALFGSLSRDESTEESDVDLLMECTLRSYSNRFALQEHLEKEFGRKVDVTYFDSVRSFYMRFIKKDLVYAYKENP